MDRLVGTLSSLSVYNDKWGRGRIRLDDGHQIDCVGAALVGLKKGNRYRIEGRVGEHARYGRQIAVSAAVIDLPCTEEVLVQHLCRNFKGCGEVTARKLVAQHRDNLAALRETLIRNPYALDFSGVTKRSVRAADDIDLAALIYRDLAARLASLGARDAVLRRLALWLAMAGPAGDDPMEAAWQRLRAEPYAPLAHVEGYDFLLADRIGRLLADVLACDPARLSALAMHALQRECEQHGHTHLSLEELAAAIESWDAQADPQQAIAAATASQAALVEDQGRYYPRALFFHETALANALAKRALQLAPPLFAGTALELQAAIEAAERSFGAAYGHAGDFRLDPSQHDAARAILGSSHLLHTLTASPGAGKTALMEILAHVLRGRKVLFCAPTGKAAKVLGERVKRFGFYASTIHALLGVTEDGFVHHAGHPLDAHLVVADEASMNDLALARALVDALPAGCHLLFLGDTGQLPSIGAGQVLDNLLELPGNHRQLTHTHRNCAGILDVVRQCQQGELECRDSEQVAFSHRLPAPTAAVLERLAVRYEEAVAQCGIANVGLLMPRRKGDPAVPGWNTTYLNEFLRGRINPDGRRIPGTALRMGDRIIVRKNLTLDQQALPNGNVHLEQVVNGDTGFIARCQLEPDGVRVEWLELQLDDGRAIRFPAKAIECLELAYAMTVHAAQGSEYQRVIVICTGGPAGFVHRGLLYTAFSRAREHLRVLADDAILREICERPAPPRNSALVERCRQAMRRMQHRGGR